MRDKAAFLEKYGGVYEHSPWVAEAAYETLVAEAAYETLVAEAAFGGGAMTIDQIHAAMKAAVEAAPPEKQRALLRAHPDLAVTQGLTAASTSEQAGAGLNQCTPEELAAFQKLNAAYKEKFGFPFIVAVRGLHRAEILEQFRKRINNDAGTEFRAARAQVHKIAGFRLAALG